MNKKPEKEHTKREAQARRVWWCVIKKKKKVCNAMSQMLTRDLPDLSTENEFQICSGCLWPDLIKEMYRVRSHEMKKAGIRLLTFSASNNNLLSPVPQSLSCMSHYSM